MKLKKSNIVLICLAVLFFANTAVNYVLAMKAIKEQIGYVQSEIQKSEFNKLIYY
jgi:hypothetical protein